MSATNENNTTTEKGLTTTTICDGSGLSVHGNSNLTSIDRNDPFMSNEGNGTAKFIGGLNSSCSTNNLCGSGKFFDFHTIKSTNMIATTKRNIRMELSKNELLNMLCYMEGELQARDVVIAALRNERVKNLLQTTILMNNNNNNSNNNNTNLKKLTNLPIITTTTTTTSSSSSSSFRQHQQQQQQQQQQNQQLITTTIMSDFMRYNNDINNSNNDMIITNPHAALFRDRIIINGNFISRQSSIQAIQADYEMNIIIEQQLEQLRSVIVKQRLTHKKMLKLLNDTLEQNHKLHLELDDEKRKHEHDTQQGDDITYGLEMERTKLKQELDIERLQRKKLDKDIKKLQEQYDYERSRQKQIVLLLLAERKKIIMKYIEERKRSEDLAQILSEEKQRSDTIADGLEEESKKSLRMEAELEKQQIQFENEKKLMKINIIKDEKRIKELELELAQLKNDTQTIDLLYSNNKQSSGVGGGGGTARTQQQSQQHNVGYNTTKIRPLTDDSGGGGGGVGNSGIITSQTTGQSSMMNVAKIVQPTATVSSVPVSLPTTGIARSLQTLRQQKNTQIGDLTTTTAIPSSDITSSSVAAATASTSASSAGSSAPPAKVTPRKQQQQQLPSTSSTTLASAVVGVGAGIDLQHLSLLHGTGGSGGGAIVPTGTGTLQQQMALSINQQRTTANVAVAAAGINPFSGNSGRGIPPPIPPNKPIVPPKREPSISRISSSSSSCIGGGSGGVISSTIHNNNLINNTNLISSTISGSTATPQTGTVTNTATAVTTASAIQNNVISNQQQIHSPTVSQ